MLTLLFVAICIIFIGLGLPDSLLGSAWPTIYQDLNLPFSYANFITFLISFGTVMASFFSARLINKFGTAKLTTFSTILSALCILAFSFSKSMIFFCLLSIPLGMGAGAIDAALNNYVAVHYSSTHMSLLHCFYGIGVSLSPFLMALALGQANDWRQGYRIVFLVMMFISLIALFSLPLWKKVKTNQPKEENFVPKTMSLVQMLKTPAVVLSWVMFFSSVALEFTCGIWACTYLVNTQKITEATASTYLTFYYAGITIGRFTSGFYSKKFAPEKSVFFGYTIVGIALIMLFLPLPIYFKAITLFLIGFGNGPTFPNLIFVTPINFGKEISQSIIGSQMAFCNIGILIMPPIFGFLAQWLGLEIFPIYLVCLFVIMVLSTIIYNKMCYRLRKERNF